MEQAASKPKLGRWWRPKPYGKAEFEFFDHTGWVGAIPPGYPAREATCRRVTRLAPTQHHHTGAVLAYVFGRRKDDVFLKLKALLEPCGLTRYSTDHWGAYTRHLAPDIHSPGKRHTQKIERKHLTLRTRIKRLVRKTIC